MLHKHLGNLVLGSGVRDVVDVVERAWGVYIAALPLVWV